MTLKKTASAYRAECETGELRRRPVRVSELQVDAGPVDPLARFLPPDPITCSLSTLFVLFLSEWCAQANIELPRRYVCNGCT